MKTDTLRKCLILLVAVLITASVCSCAAEEARPGIFSLFDLFFRTAEEPSDTENGDAEDAAAGNDRSILVTVHVDCGAGPDIGSVRISPGSDVEFLLPLDCYTEVSSVDYPGEYRAVRVENGVLLKLMDVRYPAALNVVTTSDFAVVHYDPNGGNGTPHEAVYDLTLQARPNSERNVDTDFSRDGYTLVSWNTSPDGTGTRIGLGSRISPERTMTLYAEWAEWTDPALFEYSDAGEFFSVTGYTGGDLDTLVIPAEIEGQAVKRIADNVFTGKTFRKVVLPDRLLRLEREAFVECTVSEVVMFDDLVSVYNESFYHCTGLKTLYINGVIPPFGVLYRRESVFADKIDLLITTMDEPRLVCYGGCSMWYNLDGHAMDEQFGDRYRIVDTAINGTVSSYVQLSIMLEYMTGRDVLFHTPEVSSIWQLMQEMNMSAEDTKLWAALQQNYDLFSLVDLRKIPTGVFDSYRRYMRLRENTGSYTDVYKDSEGRVYMDEYGCIPFERTEQKEKLGDKVILDRAYLQDLSNLSDMYRQFTAKGIPILVSYAALDTDDVKEEERGDLQAIQGLMEDAIGQMEGVTLISDFSDYLFPRSDYYDTVWHLLSPAVRTCTERWIRDLMPFIGEEKE